MMNEIQARETMTEALRPHALETGELAARVTATLVAGKYGSFYIERKCVNVRSNGGVTIEPLDPTHPH